jgi:hypothetical protein
MPMTGIYRVLDFGNSIANLENEDKQEEILLVQLKNYTTK